jgi:uncharacterized membrane protein
MMVADETMAGLERVSAQIVGFAGTVMELAGVAVIVGGAALSTGAALWGLRKSTGAEVYHHYRTALARSILLGLELLVAGDIIRTVAIDPSGLNVLALGGVVLIRTFLSCTLEMEVTGRWPWNRNEEERARDRRTV